MLLDCTNRGCYSHGEHLLDESAGPKAEGGIVFCIECGEAINVPRTTKKLLKDLGQIRKQINSGLQFTCKGCGSKDKPALKKLSGNVTVATCRSCGKQLDIHPSFVQALKFIKIDDEDSKDKDDLLARPVIKTKTTSKKANKVEDGSTTAA